MTSATAQAGFAFGAGIATFFSPCVFALLPGYISYYVTAVDGESPPLAGATVRGLAATGGAFVTFGVLSILAVAAGETIEWAIPVVEPLIGVALVGLGLLVFWKGSFSLSVPLPERRTSVLGFGIFGAVYAIAATACVLPLFLSVAVLSFDLSVAGTVLVLGAYATSFGALMIAATIATAVGYDAVLGQVGSRAGVLTRVAAVVLVLAGIGQIYIALTYTTA